MLPGPTLIYQCPSCQGLFSRSTIASGNTFRARYRSDGRMDPPMLPMTPPLVSCPHCETTLCFMYLKHVGEYEYEIGPGLFDPTGQQNEELRKRREENEQAHEKFWNVPKYKKASSTQCLSYLANATFDAEEEKYLRLYTMQVINDERSYREPELLTPEEIDSFAKLAQLLGTTSEQELILRAEALRELGRFDEVKELLNRDLDNGVTAEQILRKAEQHDCMPFTLAGKDDQYEFEYAWEARRYCPENIPVLLEELDPPLFKINNRDWYVKVLGMLSHNWALIEEQVDGRATVYFFHDQAGRERAGVIDSLDFPDYINAVMALERNDFKLLKNYPGPWMGCEPRGYFYDARKLQRINQIF